MTRTKVTKAEFASKYPQLYPAHEYHPVFANWNWGHRKRFGYTEYIVGRTILDAFAFCEEEAEHVEILFSEIRLVRSRETEDNWVRVFRKDSGGFSMVSEKPC